MNTNPMTEFAAHGLIHGQKTVTVSAAVLIAANEYRRSILIQNLSATNDIYVGNSNVSTSNSIKIVPGDNITLYTRSAIYAVSSADTCDVRYMEEQSNG
jgi:hypothetical protein